MGGGQRPHRTFRQGVRDIFVQQDWALLLYIILCGIGIAIMQGKDPIQRDVFINDATISYPHKDNTIDEWLAPFVPAVVFIGSLFLVECYLFRRGHVDTIAAMLRFFMSCLAALAFVGFLTELFKLICGRLRPDYLDRCQPVVPATKAPLNLDSYNKAVMKLVDSWKTFGGRAEIGVECSNNISKKEMRDGRLSFPSGHSSTAYVVGWYGCFYLLWGVSMRGDHRMDAKLYQSDDGFFKRLGKELFSSALLGLMLFQLAYAWGVGVSRFRDNRHNASDILAGFLLGLTFAGIFLLRAVGQHEWWLNWYKRQDPASVMPLDEHVEDAGPEGGDAAHFVKDGEQVL